MARSRIKSEEEYNEILGVKNSQTSNNDTVESSSSNPFNKVVSLDDIKKSLHQDSQPEVEVDSEPVRKPEPRRQSFNFEENSKKLYENLRGSNISTRRTSSKIKSSPDDVKVNEIDIIDEVSVTKARTQSPYSDGIIPNTSPLAQEFDRFEYNEPIDKLDLTADFTAENENFIEAINQKKKEVEMPAYTSEIETPPAFQGVSEPRNVEVPKPEVFATDANDIEMQLAQQLDALDDGAPMQREIVEPPVESQPMFQQQEIVPPFIPNEQMQPISEKPSEEVISNRNLEDELDFMAKNTKKANFNDTLTLALDPEHTTNFSKDDMDALKSNEMTMELEKSKRRPIDIITTVILVILIIVVIALLVKFVLG